MRRFAIMVFLIGIALLGALLPVSAQSSAVAMRATTPEYQHRTVVVDHQAIDITELEQTLPAMLREYFGAELLGKDTIILPNQHARNEYAASLAYLKHKVREWEQIGLSENQKLQRRELWQHHRWHDDGDQPFDGWRAAKIQIDKMDAALADSNRRSERSGSERSSSAGSPLGPLLIAGFLLLGFVLVSGRTSPATT